MPARFGNGEKCDGFKICAAVHTIPAGFENDRKFDGNYRLVQSPGLSKSLMPGKFTCVEKGSIFIIFECSYDAIFKMCRLEFRFQSLPFSKSSGKKCAIFV